MTDNSDNTISSENVKYVATADNIADFFTKQMHSWKQFYRFRRVIMNEPDPTADEA